MSNRYFLPREFAGNDPIFSNGGLLDRMFDTSFPWKVLKAVNDLAPSEQKSDFLPKIDVKSDAKAYSVQAEIPGVQKDEVKVEVHDGMLILSGEKKEEVSEGEGTTKHVVERRYGSFERSMTLPDDADIDNIRAAHKNGVLTITIPRTQPKENKKAIDIQSEDA